MNDAIKKELEEIDLIVEKSNYKEAYNRLANLMNQNPNEGAIPFRLGCLALELNENDSAMHFFLISEKAGYNSADLFFSMGLLLSETGNIVETEKRFNKAIELSDSVEMKWAALSALATFYLECEMFLKAEKISKILISDYQENYQGYHIHIMSEIIRRNYDEVLLYMEKLPEKFKTNPQYLIDIVEIYKAQEKTDELLSIFNEDNRFNRYIPQIVLREKIIAMSSDEDVEEKEKLVYQLAEKYHDKNSILAIMILEFSRQNYKRSSEFANIILENDKSNESINFFFAVYYQIFNFYYMSNKKPSEKLVRWIETAGNWCIRYVEGVGSSELIDATRKTIQGLFDEINSNITV